MIIDGTRLQAWTALHGIGFGALFMLGLAGAAAQAYRNRRAASPAQTALRAWVILMCVAVWLMVLSGTYVVYPAYKEITSAAAASAADLGKMRHIGRLHLGNWLDVVLFWKEYAAWIAPIGMTMLTFLYFRDDSTLLRFCGLRRAALGFAVAIGVVMVTAASSGYVLNHDASAVAGSARGKQALSHE